MSNAGSKSYLDKLHLSRGLVSNSVESYNKNLNGLSSLKVSDLKKYFHIYKFIYDDLLLYVYPVAKNSLLSSERSYNELISVRTDITDYFNGRIKEEDTSVYVDMSIYKDWFSDIQLDIFENYTDYERIDIFIKCCNLLYLIDYLLVLKDEYWVPHFSETVLKMVSINFKFEKLKERIWQPKN